MFTLCKKFAKQTAHFSAALALIAASATAVSAQEPGISQRGAVNGVTFQLAPSVVAPGSFISLFGPDLASGTAGAEAIPLPTILGDPEVKVLINGIESPLLVVSAGQINAQVPWEIEPGVARVVVQRGGVDSQPMLITVQEAQPSFLSFSGGGFGPVIAIHGSGPASGQFVSAENPPEPRGVVVLYGTGLGSVTEPIESGNAGPANPLASASMIQRATVGGMPAKILFAGLIPNFVGLFQINLELPLLTDPGEVLSYFSDTFQANSTLMGTNDAPLVKFMPLPEGSADSTRLFVSDLNGRFVALSGALDEEEGCYQDVFVMDLRREKSAKIEDCVLPTNPNALNPNQLVPFIAENDTSILAALVAPAIDQIPEAGVSTQVLLLDGADDSITKVDLPSATHLLDRNGQQQPGLRLELAGGSTQPALINTQSREVVMGEGVVTFSVDVNGLTERNSQFVGFGDGFRAAAVGDDQFNPTQSVLVVVDAASQVLRQAPFPDGFLPFVPPRRTNRAGTPVGNSFAAAARGFEDSPMAYVLARSQDGMTDAIVGFNSETAETSVVPFPDGIAAASCTPALRIQRLNLTQRLAIPSASSRATEFANPCDATGLVLFTPADGSITNLPASGLMDAGQAGEVNDYIYANTADRDGNISTSLFVFDGVSDEFTEIVNLDGASGYLPGGQGADVPGLASIVLRATATRPGDQGFLVFNLSSAQASHYPLPEGYTRIQAPLGLLRANRKLIARGIREGGSEFIVWDLATKASQVVPNPEGVAFVAAAGGGGGGGGGPGAGGGGRPRLFTMTQNGNSVVAAAFNADRQPIGIVVVSP